MAQINQAKLYLVPTPIGNLEDITLRALRILKECDIVLAEDTRVTGKLLHHYEISKKMMAHHQFNEHHTLQNIVNLIQSGNTIALVTDAGTPAISDPGYLLVRECIKNNIDIECLPGASAFVVALVNSGIPNDRFCFEGFLPHKKGRQTRLQFLANEERTMVFYESPHRLVKSLTQLAQVFGKTRKACVSRELTKLFEENARGTLEELIVHFSAKTIKGEIVIVVEGKVAEKTSKYGKDEEEEES